MTTRLELLNGARAKLDVLQERSDNFRAVKVGEVAGDLSVLKTEVAKLTDDLLSYLRTNFPADETAAKELSAYKDTGDAAGLTEDHQALKSAVRQLTAGGDGTPTTFEPETLVGARDGVIIVRAMKHLLSTIKAPLNSQESKNFDDFSKTYKGVIVA